jgi:hypothetical protein
LLLARKHNLLGRMARRLRIEYQDAIYHIVARGNGRQEIVRDDIDRGGVQALPP